MTELAPRPYEAVSFDVDGTLYALEGLKLRFALRHPLTLRALLAMGDAREELRRERVERADLLAELDRRTAARLGWEPARLAALREQVWQRMWPEILARQGPLPGLRHLLDRLVAQGVRLAILSDYPCRPKLRALGLDDLPWAVTIDGTAVGALKPVRRPFDALLAGLALPPARILHVGDRFDSDVEGARAAGMHAALRTGGLSGRGTHPAGAPDFIRFASYEQLEQRLFPAGGQERGSPEVLP